SSSVCYFGGGSSVQLPIRLPRLVILDDVQPEHRLELREVAPAELALDDAVDKPHPDAWEVVAAQYPPAQLLVVPAHRSSASTRSIVSQHTGQTQISTGSPCFLSALGAPQARDGHPRTDRQFPQGLPAIGKGEGRPVEART